MPAGLASGFFLRPMKKKSAHKMARTAMPPTTPPTIAAMGVVLAVVAGVCVAAGLTIEVVVGPGVVGPGVVGLGVFDVDVDVVVVVASW